MHYLALAKLALLENAFHMGEGFKPVLAVIGAHPRRTNAAKRNVFLDNVPRTVINRHTARDGFI